MILKESNLTSDIQLKYVNNEIITIKNLKDIIALAGSYERFLGNVPIFTKKNQELTERDYKHYILEHYTFLSRLVIISDDNIFIGNSKHVVEAAKMKINN